MDKAETTLDMQLAVTYQGYIDWIEKNFPDISLKYKPDNNIEFLSDRIGFSGNLHIEPGENSIRATGKFTALGNGNWAIVFCERSENEFPVNNQIPPLYQTDLEKVRSYSIEGKNTIPEIALKVGVSESTVKRYRRLCGIRRKQ